MGVTDPRGLLGTRDLGTGRVVLIGYDYYIHNDDAARIIAHAVRWAQTKEDVSWLAESTDSGALSGPGSQDLSMTFDAAGLTAGTYRANLLIFDDDPGDILVTVPVMLIV